MTLLEYQDNLKKIDEEARRKKNLLVKQYCDSNNTYKVGDIFTDHIGSIKIQEIKYSLTGLGKPCCVYIGIELKKDLTPKKNAIIRDAWQSNEVKN